MRDGVSEWAGGSGIVPDFRREAAAASGNGRARGEDGDKAPFSGPLLPRQRRPFRDGEQPRPSHPAASSHGRAWSKPAASSWYWTDGPGAGGGGRSGRSQSFKCRRIFSITAAAPDRAYFFPVLPNAESIHSRRRFSPPEPNPAL